MRKPCFAEIVLALALLLSCSTTDKNEIWLEKAYALAPEEALDVYLEAVQDHPSPELMYNLAYTYLQLGMADEAVMTAESALAVNPGLLRFEYLKASAYRTSGKYYSYERQLEHILSIDPGNKDIRHTLMNHYEVSGKREKAISLAKDALRRNPDDTEALDLLSRHISFYAAVRGGSAEETPSSAENWDNGPKLYHFTSLVSQEERIPQAFLEDIAALEKKRKELKAKEEEESAKMAIDEAIPDEEEEALEEESFDDEEDYYDEDDEEED